MIKVKYRLEDYIITGYDETFFTWEMNMVLGEHRVGYCFIIGFYVFLSILTKVVHLFRKTRDCISKIVKKKGRPL